MMQRRHFAAIAAVIKDLTLTADNRPSATIGQRAEIADRFANVLQHHNPNFDRDRFLRACGVES